MASREAAGLTSTQHTHIQASIFNCRDAYLDSSVIEMNCLASDHAMKVLGKEGKFAPEELETRAVSHLATDWADAAAPVLKCNTSEQELHAA